MGYRAVLIRAYKAGDFAQTYPLARGTAPLLTALGAHRSSFRRSRARFAIARHRAVVARHVADVVSRPCRAGGDQPARRRLCAADSIFIAGYTLSDGSGARLAQTASSYAAWLFLCDGCGRWRWRSICAGPAILPAMASEWKAGAVHRRAQRRRLLDRHVGDDQGADRLGRGAARDVDPVRHADLGLRAEAKR